MAFEQDWGWQKNLLPEVKRQIASHLVREAPVEEDMRRNTDLIVLKLDTIRVACRLRRYKYVLDYGDQFTIRAGRPSGAMTELTKILSGWGDYIFYGFADKEERSLFSWLLGDLNVFRLWHQQETWRGNQPGRQENNDDNSSHFRAYRVADLPDDFIVTRVVAGQEAA